MAGCGSPDNVSSDSKEVMVARGRVGGKERERGREGNEKGSKGGYERQGKG